MINFVDEWERVLTNKDKIYPRKAILFVYSIVFDDKSVYVGITKNPQKRRIEHESKSGNIEVRRRIGSIGYSFNVVHELFDKSESMMENNTLMDYMMKGYSILNKATITTKNQRISCKVSK